jgi:hypothetical protein
MILDSFEINWDYFEMPSHLLDLPCKRGHVGKRSPKTGKCAECVSINFKRRYSENPEKFKKASNKWYHSNTEKAKAAALYWRNSNPEKSNWSMRNWQELNKNQMRETAKVYRASNRKRHCARQSQRKSAQLNRTPKWANLKAIAKFYIDCPTGLTVDHIIPLQGKLVSGLHVFSNLQYLTPLENSMKNNKFDPNTWEEK